MGWIIGGLLLFCCLGVPLLIRMVQRRRRGNTLDAETRQSEDTDEHSGNAD